MKSIDELAILTALHCLYCEGSPVSHVDLYWGTKHILREIGVSQHGNTLAALNRMAEAEIGMVEMVDPISKSAVLFPKQATLAEALDEAPF